MAGPQNVPPDVSMLEVATPATHPSRIALSSGSERDNYMALPHTNGPVMISMSQEEYITRTSRESVLQRLSEALLRHSLAKVRKNYFLFVPMTDVDIGLSERSIRSKR